MSYSLDFEKPVEEIEEQIQNLVYLDEVNQSKEHASQIRQMRRLLTATKKQIYSALTPWQRVQLARHPRRPYSLDYISRLFTDFMELHGDRRFADDGAIIGGFAKFEGTKIMVIATQKGRDIKENIRRNFGSPNPEGYRKALRLMKMADLANVPIVSFIDTPGAYPGIGAEERHIGEAIAVNLKEMFSLKVPVICIVIGEGGSGGALALGIGNKVFLLENAYYSAITPEGCAAILWKDRAFTPNAATSLKLTASELLKLGIIDGIINEPIGGAHHNYAKAAAYIRVELRKSLKSLSLLSAKKLVESRYEKFRNIRFYQEGD